VLARTSTKASTTRYCSCTIVSVKSLPLLLKNRSAGTDNSSTVYRCKW
jgi:hypothetical protein